MAGRNERKNWGERREKGVCVVWFGILPSGSLLSRYVHLFDRGSNVGVE